MTSNSSCFSVAMANYRRRVFPLAAVMLAAFFLPSAAQCQPSTLRLLILGDSLSSGYDLPEQQGFGPVLARRLRVDGFTNVEVVNGSMAGDTTADAAKRLASTPGDYGADVVIVELGGNDMLVQTDPADVSRNLDWILSGYQARGARVILGGMLSKPELGFVYNVTFDQIYPKLAARWRASLYPFFLQGVFGHPGLQLSDHIHPNAAGVERIVAGIAPIVEANLRAASGGRPQVGSR